MELSTEDLLHLRELELKDLLETVQAINSNASEDDLYRIFKFIMSSSPNRSKMAFYVWEEGKWACKEAYGCPHTSLEIALPFSNQEICREQLLGEADFQLFDRLVIVSHKELPLACVLLGLIQEQAVESELEFVEALANIIMVAIENKKMTRKEVEEQNYKLQMNIAEEVQSLLFPRSLPDEPQLKMKASYLPHHKIGGDYYDYFRISEHQFMLCVADVSGKGIPAAILMSNFQAGLRLLVKQKHDLASITTQLNELIMLNSQGANFITAFFFHYDYEKQEAHYVNAGHNPPILISPEGEMQRLDKGTTVVGGFDELPFLEVGKLEQLTDFFLFAFTDGFIETYNEKNEEFGEETFKAFLSKNFKKKQEKLHKDLLSLLKNFKGANEYIDDITLLSCKVSSNN